VPFDPRGDNRSDRRSEGEAYREKTSHSEVNVTGAIVAMGREKPDRRQECGYDFGTRLSASQA
jgi:hypothetical protein